MSNLPTVLSVDSFAIRQDSGGRYCLNDLHKASGTRQEYRPKYWLATQQANDLIEELRKPLIFFKGGILPLNINQPVGVIYGGKTEVHTLSVSWSTPTRCGSAPDSTPR
jgi:hypothetical protein